MKTTLHLGADKCGSSSIQSALSFNPQFKNINGENFKYGVINKGKILFDNQIKYRANKKLNKYLSSDSAKNIYSYPKNQKRNIINQVSKNNNNLIFSCEGWLRINEKKYILNLIDLIRPKGKFRDLEIICFVRSPVEWINSAWWQWGIWNKETKNFNEWIDKIIHSTNWFHWLNKYKEIIPDANIIVLPYEKNIDKIFFKTQEINNFVNQKNINRSLPTEIIKLYLFNRLHRPSEHENYNDFLFSNIIFSSSHNYSNCPWILDQENIKKILKKTENQNKSLISLMKTSNAQKIINDPSWWDVKHFENKKVFDPYLRDLNHNKNYLKLSSDLLLSLNKATKILSRYDLMDEFIDSFES